MAPLVSTAAGRLVWMPMNLRCAGSPCLPTMMLRFPLCVVNATPTLCQVV
jgi:hypothetical protein